VTRTAWAYMGGSLVDRDHRPARLPVPVWQCEGKQGRAVMFSAHKNRTLNTETERNGIEIEKSGIGNPQILLGLPFFKSP
jgi:hypothetical protein